LWYHPQLNTDSESFQQATANGFLVRDITGEVPGLTRWWNGPHSNPWSRGVAGLVDVSDDGATQWHRDRLVDFQKRYAVDRFHLAGGETVSWPLHSTVFTHVFPDPNEFTHHIAKLLSSLSNVGDLTIVQSAYRCQRLPILVRVSQGSSSWHDIGGLHSVIPSALSLSLIGYPFFIPEAVGGSAFNGPPSKELYIRWLQLAAFLPIMHFSIPPDHYDAETVSIAEKMMSLHNELVAPTVISLINESAAGLLPIVRPLWWLAPTEHEALVSDTQFMLGDTILVAPVVEQGARHRTIYLPSGNWQDQITGLLYTGPISLAKYPVPLDHIPHFIRQT
jgi:myogenesis-regulating glycosidase